MRWERRMVKIRRLLIIVAVAMSITMPGTGGAAREPADVTFDTNVVPGTTADKPVRLNAQLFMPTADTPVSVVAIMPSSGGVKADIELYYAWRLAQAGIAALVVDSFGSRGLKNSIYDQSVLNPWLEENDAFGALQWLASDNRFRRDRIGIAGVSKGGIAALHTALTMRREWTRIGEPRFAAHVPIVPECSWVPSSFQTTGSPILFLLAELDDQTPPGPCITYSEKLRDAGNRNVEVQLYRGVHHAWEVPTKAPYFDARAENYSRCQGSYGRDGAPVTANGERLPRGDGVYAWAKANCVTLGTHCCGGKEEDRVRSSGDMIAFLKKHGF